MDMCKYAYYDTNEKYMPRLYCNIDNNFCIYSKKCLKAEKFIPLENEVWKECYKFNMAKKENIPKNSYYVQTYKKNKKGKIILYVLIEDNIVKITTNLEDFDQDYIYIKKYKNNYQVSLNPFETTKKESTNRRSKK